MDPKSQAKASTIQNLATAASLGASAMFVGTVINNFLPIELRNLISKSIDKLRSSRSTIHTLVIQKHDGFKSNEIFDAAVNYLRNKISPTVRRLRGSKNKEQNHIEITIDNGEEQTDTYEGAEFRWQLHTQRQNRSNNHGHGQSSAAETQWFELTFHSKHRDIAVNSYIPHIVEESKAAKEAAKKLQLYMNKHVHWIPTKLQHPSTFDTLAMETELKQTVEEDLKRFVKRKEYYKRIGKTWKRGYLIEGPPGTGKTSLIAAMANYLRFNIYDLDLKAVRSNIILHRLIQKISNKSMLVIEGIDCSIAMQNREEDEEVKSSGRVTLSGLLKFIDGLWSTSGVERIIVFTTNHKDRLDPALIRPGRMDVHIHMGYCSPSSFRVLASNYHGIDEHPLFGEIEELLGKVEATPAEIAEELTRRTDADEAIDSIIKLLHRKRKTSE